MAGESLLVVDENLIHAKLLSVLLRAAGYQVRIVSDPAQVLESVEQMTPRLILVDINVSYQGGLAMVKQIRGTAKGAKARILMITACVETGEEKKLLEAGCDGYLSKPIDTRELPQVVAGYLKD